MSSKFYFTSMPPQKENQNLHGELMTDMILQLYYQQQKLWGNIGIITTSLSQPSQHECQTEGPVKRDWSPKIVPEKQQPVALLLFETWHAKVCPAASQGHHSHSPSHTVNITIKEPSGKMFAKI
jgi:hypothetical protein